jgi:hypothetical protein
MVSPYRVDSAGTTPSTAAAQRLQTLASDNQVVWRRERCGFDRADHPVNQGIGTIWQMIAARNHER